MNDIVVLYALPCVGKENGFFGEETLCVLFALCMHVVVHCLHRMGDKPSLCIEQECTAVLANFQ